MSQALSESGDWIPPTETGAELDSEESPVDIADPVDWGTDEVDSSVAVGEEDVGSVEWGEGESVSIDHDSEAVDQPAQADPIDWGTDEVDSSVAVGEEDVGSVEWDEGESVSIDHDSEAVDQPAQADTSGPGSGADSVSGGPDSGDVPVPDGAPKEHELLGFENASVLTDYAESFDQSPPGSEEAADLAAPSAPDADSGGPDGDGDHEGVDASLVDGGDRAPLAGDKNSHEPHDETAVGAEGDAVSTEDASHSAYDINTPVSDEGTTESPEYTSLAANATGEWEASAALDQGDVIGSHVVNPGDTGSEGCDASPELSGDSPTPGDASETAAAKAVFGDAIRDTPVGSSFLPEADQSAAFDVPPYPGEYVLDVHGSPNSVGVNGSELTAAEFADVVRERTTWDGQEPIRLFSCHTGHDPEGFAQQLADELGVPVTSPTQEVWSSADGSEPVVSATTFDANGFPIPIDPPTGNWVTSTPRDKDLG